MRRLPGVVAVVRDGRFLGVVAEREEQAVNAMAALRARARWSEPETLPAMNELHTWLLAQPASSFRVVDGVPVDGPIDPIEIPDGCRPDSASDVYPSLPYARIDRAVGGGGRVGRWGTDRVDAQPGRVPAPRLRSRMHWASTRTPCASSTSRAPVATATTAPTTRRSTRRCWRARSRDDPCACNGCARMSTPGSRTVRRWLCKVQASLDDGGHLLDWNHDVWSNTHMARALPYGDRSGLLAAWHRASPLPRPQPFPMLAYHAGIHRNADPLYTVPRRRIVKHFVENTPLRVSSTRSLGAYANVFAIESFMDELAHAARIDPLEFRLRHLDDARARAVLSAAAERAGWTQRRKEFGRGSGIGFARYKNQKCYAAVVAEVRVDLDTAAIRLERAVIAADAGQIIDPSGLANQLEGGLIQSASWTLKEQVVFDRTRVTSVDWESYPILKFPEVPEIETVLLDRPGEPALGSGEATQGPTAGAIANAVFDAIGVRLREIPVHAGSRARRRRAR